MTLLLFPSDYVISLPKTRPTMSLPPNVCSLIEEVLAAPVPSEQLENLLEFCNAAMKAMDNAQAQEFWVRLTAGGVDDFDRSKRIHSHMAYTLLNRIDPVTFPAEEPSK